MKRSKPCLPRKLKKAVNGMEIFIDTGEITYSWLFRLRRYPRTKWVVRAERQFRQLWREYQAKNLQILELEKTLQLINKGDLPF